MEMIHLTEWLPKPGELIEFVPTAATLNAAAATPASPIPPSFIQEFHIRYWRERRVDSDPDRPDVRTELSLAFRIDEPLDRAALRAAFTAFLHRHDSLRCWFDVDDTTMTRHQIDADAVALETVVVGGFDSGEALRDRLGARFRAPDPTAWPAFACGAIDHGADGFTVYYSIDHAYSDGASLVAVLFELHQLYTAHAAGREPALPPVGGYSEYARRERALVAAEPPELEQLANILAGNADRMRPTPWDLGLAPGEFGDSTGLRFDVLTGAECEAFGAACEAGGGSYAAGIYAAIALTELELDGRTRYLGLNVVGTRDDPQFRFTQGWFVNLVPVTFEVGAAASFRDLVGRARTAVSETKPLASIPLLAAMARAAETTGRELPPVRDWPWVSYMDMRMISGAILEQSLPGLGEIHGLGSSARISQPSPLWFNREHDRVHVAVMFPDTARARESVTGYLERLRTILRTVAATGDFATATRGSEVT